MYKTSFPKLTEIKQDWYVVDAEGVVLGRLASKVAAILRGKNKPYFTPHLDTGDYVIVINADKVRLTGRKAEIKTYFKHSGYLGHERFLKYNDVFQPITEEFIERAVKGNVTAQCHWSPAFPGAESLSRSRPSSSAQQP